ncbi:MAG: hypothetical protein F9K44_07040 [Hyphomicrobiaceae bacterium]|nr:MAG: hypothetical protein F9K44_07040 [Hyphomicrobiaceae bacterium]
MMFATVASSSGASAQDRDCIHQLIKENGREIACTLPLQMTEKDLADLRKASRDILQDASCVLTIKIERALISDAVANAQMHVFESPPQPVACEIKTKETAIPVSFTFAPRVEFKDGQAIRATPGMANVSGVSRLLSLPVVVFINSSRHVETGMLETVNAYLRYVSSTKAAKN